MTERQETQWPYAKGLELAILPKGAPAELPSDGLHLKDFIRKNYDPLAEKIIYKIIYYEQEKTHKD